MKPALLPGFRPVRPRFGSAATREDSIDPKERKTRCTTFRATFTAPLSDAVATGVRASLQKAQELKREAPEVIEAISAGRSGQVYGL